MAVIDQATDGVLQTLALSGTNPYRSAYSAAPRRVYVASTGTVDFAAPACVESINLAGETPVAEGCLFTSEQLGGSPLDIRVSDQDGIGAVSVIFPNEEGVLETNAQSFTLDPPALSGVFYTGEILDMDFVRTAGGLRVLVADWNGSHYAGPGADAEVESIDNSMVTIGTGEGAYRIRPMRIAVARPSTERDE